MGFLDVQNELNTFLYDTLITLSAVEGAQLQLSFHSNVLPDKDTQALRVFVNTQVIREGQDTLSVNVTDFGRVRYTGQGVYAISFFMPRNITGGYTIMSKVAQGLKLQLRKLKSKCTWVRNVTATPYNVENNCYRYEVTFSFHFDEII